MDELVICKELTFAYLACEVVRRLRSGLGFLERGWSLAERWVIFLGLISPHLQHLLPLQ